MQSLTMVGVSTKQNTTNAIPCLQLQARAMVLIETEFAKEKKWSDGLNQVMTQRGISCLEPIQITNTNSSRIELIRDLVAERLQSEPAVLFNLGGGLKAQQIGLWEVFSKRNNPNDMAAYANYENGQLEIWTRVDGILKHHAQPLDSTLGVAEILTIFGRVIDSYDKNPVDYQGKLYELYQNSEMKRVFNSAAYKIQGDDEGEEQEQGVPEFELDIKLIFNNFKIFEFITAYTNAKINKERQLRFVAFVEKLMAILNPQLKPLLLSHYYTPEIRAKELIRDLNIEGFSAQNGFPKWWTTVFIPALREVIEGHQNKAQEVIINLPDRLEQIAPGDYTIHELAQKVTGKLNLGFLFEEVFWDWLQHEGKDQTLGVVEILKSVKLEDPSKKGIAEAEHDYLIATKKGALVSLDAKLGDITTKDLNSRLLQLDLASGTYARFAVVTPLDDAYHKNGLQSPIRLAAISYFSEKRLPILGFGYRGTAEVLHNQSEENIKVENELTFFKKHC
jgi:hypothetical protein